MTSRFGDPPPHRSTAANQGTPLLPNPIEPLLAETWGDLEAQLDWSDGHWLGWVEASWPSAVRLVAKAKEYLKQEVSTIFLAEQTAESAIEVLLTEMPQNAPLTVIMCRRAYAESLERWKALHMLLNERRERLRRRIHGGVLFLGPPGFMSIARDVAPDLWTMRSIAARLDVGAANERARAMASLGRAFSRGDGHGEVRALLDLGDCSADVQERKAHVRRALDRINREAPLAPTNYVQRSLRYQKHRAWEQMLWLPDPPPEIVADVWTECVTGQVVSPLRAAFALRLLGLAHAGSLKLQIGIQEIEAKALAWFRVAADEGLPQKLAVTLLRQFSLVAEEVARSNSASEWARTVEAIVRGYREFSGLTDSELTTIAWAWFWVSAVVASQVDFGASEGDFRRVETTLKHLRSFQHWLPPVASLATEVQAIMVQGSFKGLDLTQELRLLRSLRELWEEWPNALKRDATGAISEDALQPVFAAIQEVDVSSTLVAKAKRDLLRAVVATLEHDGMQLHHIAVLLHLATTEHEMGHPRNAARRASEMVSRMDELSPSGAPSGVIAWAAALALKAEWVRIAEDLGDRVLAHPSATRQELTWAKNTILVARSVKGETTRLLQDLPLWADEIGTGAAAVGEFKFNLLLAAGWVAVSRSRQGEAELAIRALLSEDLSDAERAKVSELEEEVF